MKASDFVVGERVHDTCVAGNGTVVSVKEGAVVALFHDQHGEAEGEFTFDDRYDTQFLTKGWAV